ncbi:transcriptional repressor LexA, partial [bacterium]|nr:transcriptional repressor LexA [bacterium]
TDFTKGILNMIFLTKKQKGIYDFLREYINENGYAPSIKEICDFFGTRSIATMHKQLITLENKGLIRRTPKMKRAIELVDTEEKSPDIEFVEVPVMGIITEGSPIETSRMIEYYRLPVQLCKERRVYMLEVKGDFYSNELIGDGDYVVIESKSKFDDNQIVLLNLDKKNVTIRKITRKKDKLFLHSPNPKIDEKTMDESEIRVLGVVIGVFRNYLK